MPLLANFTPSDIIFGGLVQLITLPYHRFFTYNTLRPAQEIQRHATRGGVQRTSPEREALYAVLVGWRSRKKDELNFAALAATVITAIVTASFSWPNITSSLWVGPAFWYASLSTSICGIFLSAQQLSMLSLMGELPEGREDSRKASAKTMRRHLAQILIEVAGSEAESEAAGVSNLWKLSWRLVFTWQCPMMFIAYSTLFYIIGLSVVVLTPLIREDWGENSYVAVAYAASTGLAWSLWAFCSLGGYNKISMHQRDEDEADEDGEVETYRVDAVNTAADGVADTGGVMPGGKEAYGR